ncbi:MAG: transcription termination factor Rho [Planctomycetes bacterium]|nr:transcription termination factor Rho [Planctomycetota bacterium]MCP4771716.1 transcription termination factor Rho [Planctomycetota bacterium]MCP4859984.1 transcription termination factor Rho [Planctomycetota bacterium]
MTEDQAQPPAKRRRRRRRRSPITDSSQPTPVEGGETNEKTEPSKDAGDSTVAPRKRRRRRRGGMPDAGSSENKQPQGEAQQGQRQKGQQGSRRKSGGPKGGGGQAAPSGPKVELSGILELRKDGTGFLRSLADDLAENPSDPMVPQQMVRRNGLKNGSMIVGQGVEGSGKRNGRLSTIDTIDGLTLAETRQARKFKNLTVIDPDFHYELGGFEQENQLSMRIVDLLCPIGRGQRGLLVAPPRTGKTTIMMNVAAAMEALYPDVHLIVLLVDERPEEATYWRRSIKNGEVFVSTMDQSPKNHARLSEMVQFRAERLVESGKEVMILLDSITRMTRAFNNVLGGKDSRTMSGGLDARVFQRPKHFFGAARNTENGGSLTILATALVQTGSRMDEVIFEEFKGTGNMELTLDRRLADRRIYPAVSIEHTATRKEEKLLSRLTLRKVNILRRVLSRLRPREAMEMLVDRLDRYPSNQEFLSAFSMDDVQ